MRRVYPILLVLLIAGAAVFIICRRRRSAGADVQPEVLKVGHSEVTIAWFSREPYQGRIFFRPAGSNEPPLSVQEDLAASGEHEVTITGLNPSTRYTYRVGNSPGRFQFQTQPSASTPFSFLIVWGDVSERIVQLLMSELPEFIVSLTEVPKEGVDWFSEIRPCLPIYNLSGVDSPYLRSTEAKPATDSGAGWSLDWGGLRLVFGESLGSLAGMLKTRAPHTFGIITSPALVEPFKPERVFNRELIRQTALHPVLTVHNRENPARPAAFVGVVGGSSETLEVDGVWYFGIPAAAEAEEPGKKASSGVVRIDVDVESVRAFFIDEEREIALKQPPLKEKRTCEECRRLADKGAYEESVEAYKGFIETHQGHYQIDDAYFAIAEILDEKLFRFAGALSWYQRLIEEYPGGTLIPLARQRVRHLSEYSDYDFRPLARFERIRKVEFARKKHLREEQNKLFQEVESIIDEYPDSKLAPVMQYWLGNQYRQSDPEKAVSAYLLLREKYPDYPGAEEVLMDIGQTYYEARRYPEAIAVYKKALLELPSLKDTITAQIARSLRNLRRRRLALLSGVVLALMSAGAILQKPAGFRRNQVILSLPGAAGLGVVLLFAAWLVHEQFSSVREMLLIIVSFAAAAGMGVLISLSLAEKLLAGTTAGTGADRGVFRVLVGSAAGIVFFAAGIYMAMYYINEHYLVVVGM